MMTFRVQRNMSKKGFALLLSALMSVVVLVVGLTILNTTFKQVLLAEVGMESERAFHAAYAGVECAQFWNVADVWDEAHGDTTISCGDVTASTDQSTAESDGADEVTSFEIDWESAPGNPGDGSYLEESYLMCTKIDVFKYSGHTSPVTMFALPDLTGVSTIRDCPGYVECTVVIAKGYNRACSAITSSRTVEREVIVRF